MKKIGNYTATLPLFGVFTNRPLKPNSFSITLPTATIGLSTTGAAKPNYFTLGIDEGLVRKSRHWMLVGEEYQQGQKRA